MIGRISRVTRFKIGLIHFVILSENYRKTSATYLLRVRQILTKRSKLQRRRSSALELDKTHSHAPCDSI